MGGRDGRGDIISLNTTFHELIGLTITRRFHNMNLLLLGVPHGGWFGPPALGAAPTSRRASTTTRKQDEGRIEDYNTEFFKLLLKFFARSLRAKTINQLWNS